MFMALAITFLVITLLVPLVVCALKGKWWVMLGGFLLHPLWWVGAIRLAKPESWWARSQYEPAKLEAARDRYW